jgi:valyl-tRNA synthetase
MANLEDCAVSGDTEDLKGVATAIAGNLQILVYLEGVVDIGGEKTRLEKEIAKVNKDLAFVGKKIANRDFLSRAAAAIIRKEEDKYKQLREKHAALDSALKKLLSLGI